MITLKDFVRGALEDVSAAVAEFESTEGAEAAPSFSNVGAAEGPATAKAGLLPLGGRDYATMVSFDVAITSEETDAKKGGGGIKVIPFRAEGEFSSAEANTTVSRVKFAVPLKLR